MRFSIMETLVYSVEAETLEDAKRKFLDHEAYMTGEVIERNIRPEGGEDGEEDEF